MRMSRLQGLWKYLTDRDFRASRRLRIHGDGMPDEEYIREVYRLRTGHEPDLEDPRTYTEKLQWLKLHDRKPLYTVMQDKIAVRQYVRDTIGEEYLIPLLGVWENADDVPFGDLPDRFVIKCNHDCASVIICRDRSRFDAERAREKLRACLKTNYYDAGREWAYRDIPPKILAEKYMCAPGEKQLTDYKFFCFSGEAKLVMVTSGEAHTAERRCDFYDPDFNRLPIERGRMSGTDREREKPEGFDRLIPLAEKIAGDIPFIRVDFYLIGGHPYFGEVAFYPSGGFAEFRPRSWEEKVGSWIRLPDEKRTEAGGGTADGGERQ